MKHDEKENMHGNSVNIMSLFGNVVGGLLHGIVGRKYSESIAKYLNSIACLGKAGGGGASDETQVRHEAFPPDGPRSHREMTMPEFRFFKVS